MWCVVYAGDRNEHNTERFLTHLLQGKTSARCFSLEKDRLYKNSGIWHTVREQLFPGYVFIDTDEPETIYKMLEKTSKNLLFSDSQRVCVLDQGETSLLEDITDHNGLVGISDVQIQEDKTVAFLSGPLAKIPERIKRIDLHRRFVEASLNFLHEKETIRLGIRF